MPQDYELKNAQAHIRLARYLMSKADERGMTHGEKHHIIQVCLGELSQALWALGDHSMSVVSCNADADPEKVDISPSTAGDQEEVRSRF